MNFTEALKLLMQGKEVYRKSWKKGSAWYLKDNELMDNLGNVLNDWEEVK